jgi:hypothetical protein
VKKKKKNVNLQIMADGDKKTRRMTMESGWAAWKSPVRQVLFELVFAYIVTLPFGLVTGLGSPFIGQLTSGLVMAGTGVFLSLGIGLVGSPLRLAGLATIHAIDGDINIEYSRLWFFIKTAVKVIISLLGAFLSGLTVRSMLGGSLPAGNLPANILPGSDFVTGIVVGIFVLVYYHITLLISISMDDGLPTMLIFGLVQFAFGVVTWNTWQVIPDINFLVHMAGATLAWSTFAWWDLVIEILAVVLTIVFYYVFFSDVFSSKSRTTQGSGMDAANLIYDRNPTTGVMNSAQRATKAW